MSLYVKKFTATRWSYLRAIESRIYSKHFIKNAKMVRIKVAEKLPHIVKDLHDIELAEETQKALREKAEKATDETGHLFVNIQIDEYHSITDLDKMEDIYLELFTKIKKVIHDVDQETKKVILDVEVRLAKILMTEEELMDNEFREEYKKFLQLLEEVENEGASQSVMAKIQDIFKTEGTSYFAYRAVRGEIKHFYKNKHELTKDEKELKQLLMKELKMLKERFEGHLDAKKLEKLLKDHEELIKDIQRKLVDLGKHLHDEHREAFLAIRRIIIVEFGLVDSLRKWLADNKEWVKKNLMPKKSLEEVTQELEEMKKDLDNSFREVAKDLRNLISGDEEALNKAKKIMSLGV